MSKRILPFPKNWSFIPKQSLGPIKFGQVVNDLIDILGLEPEGDLNDQLYQFYKAHGLDVQRKEMLNLLNEAGVSFRSSVFDLSITVDQEFKVSSVHTRFSCFYGGRELIGAGVDILKTLIDATPECEPHAFGYLLTYDTLDFHVYVEDQKIVSVIAASYPEN